MGAVGRRLGGRRAAAGVGRGPPSWQLRMQVSAGACESSRVCNRLQGGR